MNHQVPQPTKDVNELIQQVVHAFYEQATRDMLIGHQFRKIQAFQGQHPLRPPMEAFAEHLPRITQFWQLQFGLSTTQPQPPFQLLKAHEYLNIRAGELSRWVLLFQQTLTQFEQRYPEHQALLESWRGKISQFQQKFMAYFFTQK